MQGSNFPAYRDMWRHRSRGRHRCYYRRTCWWIITQLIWNGKYFKIYLTRVFLSSNLFVFQKKVPFASLTTPLELSVRDIYRTWVAQSIRIHFCLSLMSLPFILRSYSFIYLIFYFKKFQLKYLNSTFYMIPFNTSTSIVISGCSGKNNSSSD